ncbi:hypothetical protein HN385_03720 [archaeon]|nr:hypothetical protein [archaeon]MBT6869806.1 hypothetical protein [archaeon]MBT7380786.1 hypothetical protein [archaeon]MBT7508370.1 hypothetical protein [archaeon]
MQELNNQINQYMLNLQKKIVTVTHFVISRLKNYAGMTIGEQIAYPCIAAGILLILVSIILLLI